MSTSRSAAAPTGNDTRLFMRPFTTSDGVAMRILRSIMAILVVAQLLAVVPLASALWELPGVNLFSPPEPFEFSS